MIRRAIAVAVLTGAALFFAMRFHGPRPDMLPTVDEPDTTPAIAGPAPSSAAAPVTTSPAVVTTVPSTAPNTTTTGPPATNSTPDPNGTGGVLVFEGTRTYTSWGWVKVDISVVNGVMVDLEMVMTPRATRRSEALAREYEPLLREQALERQSPLVDVITGATVLSNGYRVSVYGAMKEAGLWPPPEA